MSYASYLMPTATAHGLSARQKHWVMGSTLAPTCEAWHRSGGLENRGDVGFFLRPLPLSVARASVLAVRPPPYHLTPHDARPASVTSVTGTTLDWSTGLTGSTVVARRQRFEIATLGPCCLAAAQMTIISKLVVCPPIEPSQVTNMCKPARRRLGGNGRAVDGRTCRPKRPRGTSLKLCKVGTYLHDRGVTPSIPSIEDRCSCS